MKTYKNLFSQIISFENLYRAAKLARKGKVETVQNTFFHFDLENQLLLLQSELKNKCYKPGIYKRFTIYDPKTRMISAAPYRDRVVHHALCQIIEPIFEKTFIDNSFANRVGKGSHRAIERFQEYAKKYPYVLKCDIRKFFPSLDHAILKQEIRWKIACPDTLWLIDTIIDYSNDQEKHIVYFPGDNLLTPLDYRRGLPIGNLTSQFWANVYLNRFDHFITEKLKIGAYIRYVDDYVVFAKSKRELVEIHREISRYLMQLRLILHPHKTQLYVCKQGVPFLGFNVFPYHRYVLKEKTKRYRRYLAKKMSNDQQYAHEDIVTGLNSWLGHVRFGQSARLIYNTFWYLHLRGLNLYQRRSGSWGLVEQQFK